MPAIILGTQMGSSRAIKWRPVTTGLQGSGPADRTLVIKFQGNPAALYGFDGRSLHVAEFRQFCELAKQDWIPLEGSFPCSVNFGNPTLITVAFGPSAAA